MIRQSCRRQGAMLKVSDCVQVDQPVRNGKPARRSVHHKPHFKKPAPAAARLSINHAARSAVFNKTTGSQNSRKRQQLRQPGRPRHPTRQIRQTVAAKSAATGQMSSQNQFDARYKKLPFRQAGHDAPGLPHECHRQHTAYPRAALHGSPDK